MSLETNIATIGAGGLHRGLVFRHLHQLKAQGDFAGGVYIGQRGTDIVNALKSNHHRFHAATYTRDGVTDVATIEGLITGAESFGQGLDHTKDYFTHATAENTRVYLVGVTEQGLTKGSAGMNALYTALSGSIDQHGDQHRLAVFCTDNEPDSAGKIKTLMLEYDAAGKPHITNAIENGSIAFLDCVADTMISTPKNLKPEFAYLGDQALNLIDGEVNAADKALVTYAEPIPGMWSLLISDPEGRLEELGVPFGNLPNPQVIVTEDSLSNHRHWKLAGMNSVHVPLLSYLTTLIHGPDAAMGASLDDEVVMKHAQAYMSGMAHIMQTDFPIDGADAQTYVTKSLERVHASPMPASFVTIDNTNKTLLRHWNYVMSEGHETATEEFRVSAALNTALMLRFMTSYGQLADGTHHGRNEGSTLYPIHDRFSTIPDALMVGHSGFPPNNQQGIGSIFSAEFDEKVAAINGLTPGRNAHVSRANTFYTRLAFNREPVMDVLKKLYPVE